MHATRIIPHMSLLEAIMALAGGNPGSVRALSQLVQTGPTTDPDAFDGRWAPLLDLDALGLYGSDIWDMYTDACGSDPVRMHAVLRGIQLGLVRAEDVRDAVSARRRLDTAAILGSVRAQLPAFAPGVS